MTPLPATVASPGPAGPANGAVPGPPAPPDARPRLDWTGAAVRVVLTGLAIAGYYWLREPFGRLVESLVAAAGGPGLDPATPRVVAVALLLVTLVIIWSRVVLRDPRFQAPLLATTILALGDATFGFLENHPAPPWLVTLTGGAVMEYNPSFVAILATVLTELILGRFYWGKWPHLASAYVSGISTGILIKSSLLWPFVLCGAISIASKYVLRVGNRHIFNPTNFGVTMMLLLAPASVASLTVQAGNNGFAIAVIWIVGCLVMARLGFFHIPAAFVATFIPLAFLRSFVTGHAWQSEIAPITSPMFQLFIFFMITDPKTTTRTWWSQVVVAMLVAVAETVLRLGFKDVHSLYHSLFIVGPIANLVEIYRDRWRRAADGQPALAGPASGTATVLARG